MVLFKKSFNNLQETNQDLKVKDFECNDIKINGTITGFNPALGSINPTSIAPGTIDQNEFSKLDGRVGDLVDTNTIDQQIQARKQFKEDITFTGGKTIRLRDDALITNPDIHSIQYLAGPGKEAIVMLTSDTSQETGICVGYYTSDNRANTFNEKMAVNIRNNVDTNITLDGIAVLKKDNLRLETLVANDPKIELYKGPTQHWDIEHEASDLLKFKFNNNEQFIFESNGDLSCNQFKISSGLLRLGASGTPTTLLHLIDANPVLQIQGSTSSTILFNSNDSKIDFNLSGQNIQMTNASSDIIFRNNTTPYARFNNDGRCSIGTNSALRTNCGLNIDSNSGVNTIGLPIFTTVQRNAITAQAGFLIYNSNLNALEYFNGTVWNDLQFSASLHEADTTTHGTTTDIASIGDVETFTNKTIAFGSNTLTNVMSINTAQTVTGLKTFNNEIHINNNQFLRLRDDSVGPNPHIFGLNYDPINESTCLSTSDAAIETQISAGYWTSNNKSNAWVNKASFRYSNVANTTRLFFDSDVMLEKDILRLFEKTTTNNWRLAHGATNILNFDYNLVNKLSLGTDGAINTKGIISADEDLHLTGGKTIRLRRDALITNPDLHSLIYASAGQECICVSLSDTALIETRFSVGYFTGDNRSNAWNGKFEVRIPNNVSDTILSIDGTDFITGGASGNVTAPKFIQPLNGQQCLFQKVKISGKPDALTLETSGTTNHDFRMINTTTPYTWQWLVLSGENKMRWRNSVDYFILDPADTSVDIAQGTLKISGTDWKDIAKTFTNTTLTDNSTTFADNTDNTKQFKFECSNISTLNVRTYTCPNDSGTLVLTGNTQNLSGKTFVTNNVNLNGVDLERDGTKVLGAQLAALTDVPTGGSATAAANATAINLIHARMRSHGLIAT